MLPSLSPTKRWTIRRQHLRRLRPRATVFAVPLAIQAQSAPPPPVISQPPPPQQTQTPATTASSADANETATMRAQRDALEKQLRQLQAEMAQASQNVSLLHGEADEQRHDLDALQKLRAAEQGRVSELEDARKRALATQSSNSTAGSKPQPEQAASNAPVAVTQAPDAVTRATAEPAQATEQSVSLPLPPPLPPQPSPPQVAAAAPPAPAARIANPGRLAADHPQRAGQNDFTAMDSVLNRLRHGSASTASRTAPASPDIAARAPETDVRGDEQRVMRAANEAYGQPRQIGPRARLGMAQASLAAGHIDEARQYLEEAQLQLVFRPVTPTGDEASGSSRIAGDVASALSMLGSGNIGGALDYVNRAMGDARPNGFPPPQGYGNVGPPMAQADR